MERYYSVDCEFSGLDHRENALLSIGIVEVEEKDSIWVPMYDRQFYIELKPYGLINEESMKINKLDVDNLEEYGSTKENAIKEMNKYLDLKENDVAVFIGYCGVLDKIFIDQMYQDKKHDTSPFNYEIIEISSLAMGKFGFKWGFNEKDLLKKLDLPELTEEEKHNALNDAILQALEFCGIMNYK